MQRRITKLSARARSVLSKRFYSSDHTDYRPTEIFTTQTGYDILHEPLMNKGTGIVDFKTIL
jgi:hypothetical protein